MFFSKEELAKSSRSVTGLQGSCQSCGLYKNVLSPRMKPFGNFKKRILNIGEAPGEDEDFKGKQWQGKVGRVLKSTYRRLGIDLFEDCLNINSINCRPTDSKGNRVPDIHEINCCRSRVMKVIQEYKPHLIMIIGNSALKSVISQIWTSNLGKISKWRGWQIPDRTHHAWICPVFHPSFVERSDAEVKTVWVQDLEKAFALLERPIPDSQDEKQQIEIVEGSGEIAKVLTKLNAGPIGADPPFVAFDYETTGLKPHAEGHKIACMAFCDSPHRAYSFERPKSKRAQKLLRDLLQSDLISKIAHNMKFEQCWTVNTLGYEVKNWGYDSMLGTHVLDNRQGITGLKFQTYVNFGVAGYDDSVSPYLKAKDSNSFNRVLELVRNPEGKRNLLTYCGMDALFTYRLAMLQMKRIGIL